MKIYVVSDGCYSDWHVCSIFSTREKAEHGKIFFNAENEIEEWEVDWLPEAPAGMLKYKVRMDRDGNVESVERDNSGHPVNFDWEPGDWYGDECKHVAHIMFARDEQHAIKIANERRIQLISDNMWTAHHEQWLKVAKPVE